MLDTITTSAPRKTTDSILPLPRIGTHVPIVRTATCGRHPYADLTYDRRHPALRFVSVLAVRDGVISYAGSMTIECAGTKRVRHSLCLDHDRGWSTRYGDLEHMFALPADRFSKRRKERVRAGDVLGFASVDPIHVSFELWRNDDEGFGPVDPAPYMRTWRVLPWLPWGDAPIANDETHQPTAA